MAKTKAKPETTIKRLADMVEPLETFLRENFPNSVFKVRHSTNIKDCVTVFFAVEPREQWVNGIFENSTNAKIMFFEARGGQREGDSGVYVVEKVTGWKLPKMRKRTGSAEQVVNHVMKWFESVKQNPA